MIFAAEMRTMIRDLTVMLAVLALLITGCTTPQKVESDQSACAAAIARVAWLRQLPPAHVASCEARRQSDVPGFYVVALRSHCREEMCGSTLIGWFAVRKSDAAVIEFNVGEWKVGQPASVRSFHG